VAQEGNSNAEKDAKISSWPRQGVLTTADAVQETDASELLKLATASGLFFGDLIGSWSFATSIFFELTLQTSRWKESVDAEYYVAGRLTVRSLLSWYVCSMIGCHRRRKIV
jgi:hypothetical protein